MSIDNKSLVPKAWSQVIHHLNEMLASPSVAYPNTRWLSETAIRRLLILARDAAGAPTSISGAQLLASLEACGLAKAHRVDADDSGVSPFKVYCLDVGGEPPISPMELLVAKQSNFAQTAICYFTALEYHQLTTQMTPHHHIAQLKDYPPANRSGGDMNRSNNPPPIGTLLFHQYGIPYYVSKRDRQWVPGIQTVTMSPHFMVRVTTLEQTLLDTLHRPWSCGGPAVVFEAWEQGAPRMDESRMGAYLQRVASSDLYRRVGYMLEQQAYTITDASLVKGIRDAKASFAADPVPPISLLPHAPQQELNRDWGLFI